VQVLVFMGARYFPHAWLRDLRLTLPAVPSSVELAEHVKKVMADGEIIDGDRYDLEVAWVTLLVIDGNTPVQQIDWCVNNSDNAAELQAHGYQQLWAGTIPAGRAGFWGLALVNDVSA
jgi:hypothetical protein